MKQTTFLRRVTASALTTSLFASACSADDGATRADTEVLYICTFAV